MMSKFEIKDDRDLGVTFIYSALDSYGLDPYEFRIYCHIARRKGLTDSVFSIATRCNIDVEIVKLALNFLATQRLISIVETAHSGSITLNDRSEWIPCDRRKR